MSREQSVTATQGAARRVTTTAAAVGPQERHDEWRSRRLRSEAELTMVYKELFFAGLPCRTPYKTDAASEHNNGDDDDDHDAGAAVDEDVTPFPESYVRDFFASYGRIETLVYDIHRGIGSVTFATGAEAERCYSFVHLSMLPHPHATAAADNDDAAARRRRRGGHAPMQNMLLCLEYAQCCPFVNPTLLLLDELHAGDMSRMQLCTYPRIERKYMASTAHAVVVRWHVVSATEGTSAATATTAAHADEQDGEDAAAETQTTSSDVLQRDGPHYPGGEVQPAVLGESLWRVLQPSHTLRMTAARARGQTVTVLDLWWEYYNRYMVHKTQPSSQRIAHVYFAAASRPSVVQEVRALERDAAERGDDSSDRGSHMTQQQLLQRLLRDDVYHGVLIYLLAVQRLRYDATWASLMRDVYTRKTVQRAQAWYAAAPHAQRDQLQLEATLSAAVANADADTAWLRLPLLQAAAHVIDNVRYLRHLAQQRSSSNSNNSNSTHKAECDKGGGAEDSEALYKDVLAAIDHYAASGSAASLLSVCEAPATFAGVAGHIGYAALHSRGTAWRSLLWMLSLPLSLLALVVCALVVMQWHNTRHPPMTRNNPGL